MGVPPYCLIFYFITPHLWWGYFYLSAEVLVGLRIWEGLTITLLANCRRLDRILNRQYLRVVQRMLSVRFNGGQFLPNHSSVRNCQSLNRWGEWKGVSVKGYNVFDFDKRTYTVKRYKKRWFLIHIYIFYILLFKFYYFYTIICIYILYNRGIYISDISQ